MEIQLILYCNISTINIHLFNKSADQVFNSRVQCSYEIVCVILPCFTIHRGLVIGALSPLLQHTGYGFNWKEGTVMCWGGLRGAVGLALALQVAHHDTIDQEKVGLRVSLMEMTKADLFEKENKNKNTKKSHFVL